MRGAEVMTHFMGDNKHAGGTIIKILVHTEAKSLTAQRPQPGYADH